MSDEEPVITVVDEDAPFEEGDIPVVVVAAAAAAAAAVDEDAKEGGGGEGMDPPPSFTPTSFEDWLCPPAEGNKGPAHIVDAVKQAQAYVADIIKAGDETEVNEVTTVVEAVVKMSYGQYASLPSKQKFYTWCLSHVNQLLAACSLEPELMAPYTSLFTALARAMWKVDALTVGGRPDADRFLIYPNTPPAARDAIVQYLDADREVFCGHLAEGIGSLVAVPSCLVMFVEFARCCFIYNNYQPPKRLNPARMVADSKGDIDHFDEILQTLCALAYKELTDKGDAEIAEAVAQQQPPGGDDDADDGDQKEEESE